MLLDKLRDKTRAIILKQEHVAIKSFRISATSIVPHLTIKIYAPCLRIRFHRGFRLVVPKAPARVN